MKKRIIPLVIVVLLASVCIYMSCSVKSEFKLYNVENGIDPKNDISLSADELRTEYHISGKRAKEVGENPDDYFTVYIACSTKNNSISTIYNIFNGFSDNKNIFVSKEMPESTSSRFVKANESGENIISLIVKKDELKNLENFKFKSIYIGYLGFSFSSSKFTGLSDIERFVTEYEEGLVNSIDLMSDDELNDFFSVSVPKDKVYNLNNYPAFSAIRYDKKSFYRIGIDEKRRCAVSLYSGSGVFDGGILMTAILPSETVVEIIDGKTTIEDIRKFDKNSFLFSQGDNKYKTYLYFSNGDYMEISFKYDGTNYIVENHVKGSYKKFCEVLISEDKAYLEKFYNIKFDL